MTGNPARRVLISTIAPNDGGVPAMTRFLVQTLRSEGYEPVLAHYEPYSVSPAMSVPSFRLLRGRPAVQQRRTLDGCETHAIGAWLPELEFTHYWPTAAWERLMQSCGAHITVAGNALAALPYYRSGRPFLAWLATGWRDDRKDRVRRLPPSRRLLDGALVSPVACRLEAAILRAGSILALSRYTQDALDSIAGRPTVQGVLPMPVDTTFFTPLDGARVRGRIGFSGRLDDPRKNLDLFIESLARVRARDTSVTALLIGGPADRRITEKIAALGLTDAVEIVPYVTSDRLRDLLRTLDLFVLPSHQEGLCIAALEAMACGCPVVSTRCGGPQEFVVEGETGALAGFDRAEMAGAILRLLGDDALRRKLGDGARARVARDYGRAKAEAVFWRAFGGRFSDRARAA